MTIHIFGGGTLQYVRNHLALCAPAYGATARKLHSLAGEAYSVLHLTKMADGSSSMETNEDVERRLGEVLADPDVHAVIFNIALCDYSGQVGEVASGKYAERLASRAGEQRMVLTPARKLLNDVKRFRPDISVVGFKTTANASAFEQERLARRQMAETGADLVLANDTVTRTNLLVLAQYTIDGPREDLLARIVELLRRP